MKLFDNIKAVYTLDAEVYTTDTVATDFVDSAGYGDGMLLVAAGDITTTSTDVYTLTVKECDTTNGTYTSTGIALTFTGLEDNTVKVARIPNLNTTRKQYLKCDMTCTGTTLSWEGAAVILMGEGASNPVNND